MTVHDWILAIALSWAGLDIALPVGHAAPLPAARRADPDIALGRLEAVDGPMTDTTREPRHRP